MIKNITTICEHIWTAHASCNCLALIQKTPVLNMFYVYIYVIELANQIMGIVGPWFQIIQRSTIA